MASSGRHLHIGRQVGVIDLDLDGHALGGLLVLPRGAVQDTLQQRDVRLAAPHRHHRLQKLARDAITCHRQWGREVASLAMHSTLQGWCTASRERAARHGVHLYSAVVIAWSVWNG